MATAAQPTVPSGTPTAQATVAIERRYPATPARAFTAFADRKARRRWCSCMDGTDGRPQGTEIGLDRLGDVLRAEAASA